MNFTQNRGDLVLTQVQLELQIVLNVRCQKVKIHGAELCENAVFVQKLQFDSQELLLFFSQIY